MNDLRGKTIRSGFAKVCAQAINFVLRVGCMMVLSRILGARDFGLVGMVTAVMGVLSLFKDFALSSATIQRTTVTNQEVSTLFWINMLVGTILGLLSLALAPALAIFYREPRLFSVTAVLGVAFVFNAAGVQHAAFLQRGMRFTTLSIIETGASLVGNAVGIIMAVAGYGYWALVGITVTSPLVLTLSAWLTTGWIPARPRKQVGLRSMIRFGGTVTVSNFITFLAYNCDKVLLGRFWGADVLGLYGRAYQLVNIPTDNITSTLGGVLFAALSRVQEDPARLRRAFLKGYSLVLALTIPTTIVCALFARDLTFVILGPKWYATAPIVRLLAPTILVFAMITPLSWLLFSIGLVGRCLKMALVLAPLLIGAYFIGVPYGAKGVALAYSTAMILWMVPHMLWSAYGTVVSFKDIVHTAIRPLASGGVAAAVAWGVQVVCGDALPPFVRLSLGGAVLGGMYIGMLLIVMGQKAFYLDLLKGLRGSSTVEGPALASV